MLKKINDFVVKSLSFLALLAIVSCNDSTTKSSCDNIPELEKLSNQGEVVSQANLASCYYKGEGVAKDFDKAVLWYRKAADQGYADAQNSLGNRYYNGEGVDKDFTKAVLWYRKAADQENADAQHNLGNRYYNGEGVAQDLSKAVLWHRKAADQGNATAQNSLASCYYEGKGVAQDFTKAVLWHRKAADQGYAAAQNNLGYLYYKGEGVAQDFTKAAKWHRKAADQGNASAQNNLGNRYSNGEGLAQDLSKAILWYKKAADQGNSFAQNSLGVQYAKGEGVTKDLFKAVQYFTKAADQGNAAAQNNLKRKLLQFASPFGCKIGITTFEEVEKMYKLTQSGSNKWSGGMMYNITPITQVDFTGINNINLIFDDNKIIQGLIAKFDKNKFHDLFLFLESKYNIVSKQIPYVGNKSAKFSMINGTIELESMHLSGHTSLIFTTNKLDKSFKKGTQLEKTLKTQKEKSML
ncbi:MAG: hypothetical protein COA94_00430 [Rickettsiales bacterium]|nr:MAG: hypothetical protein COA94_00430 [Rickettsiales bacterium]